MRDRATAGPASQPSLTTQAGGRAGPAYALIALQRRAGNTAVGGVLARRRLARSVEAQPPIVGEGFSALERQWIDDVWALPEIALLFATYPGIPQLLLDRVESLRSDTSDPEAVTIFGESIEVADNVYRRREAWNASGSDAAEFKSTLIHELFHVFEHASEDLDAAQLGVYLPSVLTLAMMSPPHVGAPPYAFGWFSHPRADGWFHFGESRVRELLSPYRLKEGDPEYAVMQDAGKWEASPDDRGPEEDVSTTLGMYLASSESRAHLEQRYPRRNALMTWFFASLRQQVEAVPGAPLR